MHQEAVPDFSSIYQAYHGRVLAYAAKLLGSDAADDVTQEVFIKIVRSLDTLADPSKLASWIYAITLNTVRDEARRRSARPRCLPGESNHEAGEEEAGDGLAGIPDQDSRSPEEEAIRNEMVACYLDHVKELPRNYYVVYALSDLEDLGNEEIARRLSLTRGTVKIRLHRARTQLHQELRRYCRCYSNRRGELMGEPKSGSRAQPARKMAGRRSLRQEVS